jgi:hypothetical protein
MPGRFFSGMGALGTTGPAALPLAGLGGQRGQCQQQGPKPAKDRRTGVLHGKPWVMCPPLHQCKEGSAPQSADSACQIHGTPRIKGGARWASRHAAEEQPFLLYVPLTHLHFPAFPHPDFAGRSGVGDSADSMIEMGHRVGQLLHAVDELGIREHTLFIFASDNGPELRRPWRGTAGPWTGTYHSAMEGGLRVPLIVRWPGPGGQRPGQ